LQCLVYDGKQVVDASLGDKVSLQQFIFILDIVCIHGGNLCFHLVFWVLPLGAVPERFEPSVTGLDIEPHKPAAEDEGREESRAAPGINRARVYRVALGDLCTCSPERRVCLV
jgi:hypothetical protein